MPKIRFLALSKFPYKCPVYRLSSNLTNVICQKLPHKMPKISATLPKIEFLALSKFSHKCPFYRLFSNLTNVICQKLPQNAKNHPILPKTKLLAHSLLFLALSKSLLATEIPPPLPSSFPHNPLPQIPPKISPFCQKQNFWHFTIIS